jgi:hypothetical protein
MRDDEQSGARTAECSVSSNRAVSATLESTAFVDEQRSRPALVLVVEAVA